MNNGFFTVGKFFGIQLRVHYSWLLIYALITWSVITVYLPTYQHQLSKLAITGAGLLVSLIFFITLIAHEYAHSIVANRHGLVIKRITLYIFGGASELEQEPPDARTELLMTVAGPLTSFILGGIFALIWLVGRHYQLTALNIIAEPVATLNLVIGLFNLLPAFPMDGGRILRSILWWMEKDFEKATRHAATTAIFLSYLMIGFGFLSALGGNILGGFWFALIGFFLMQSARLSYYQAIAQTTLADVSINAISSPIFKAVPIGTSIENFLNDFVLAFKVNDFIVIDRNAEPCGIISANMLPRTNQRPETSIDKFIRPLSGDIRLKPTDPAIKALRIMQTHGVTILPVIDSKRLVGIVRLSYIEDYLSVHRRQGQL